MSCKQPSEKTWFESYRIVFLIILVGWVVRGLVIFLPDHVPGINGAYYFVQARSILRTGWLAVPDFPLLFYIHAFVAKCLSMFYDTDRALMIGTKLVDVLFPVLIVIPAFGYYRLFLPSEERTGDSWKAFLWIGLVAVCSASILRMAGDFQKNAFALPLFLGYTYFLFQSYRAPNRKNVAITFLLLASIGLSHLGVTALTIFYTACFVLVHLKMSSDRKTVIITIVSAVMVLSLSFAIVYWFDSHRVEKVMSTFENPIRLFMNSPAMLLLTGHGVPRLEIEGYLLGNLLGIAGLMMAFRNNNDLRPDLKRLLISSSICTLFFSSPFIHSDVSHRFAMMAFVPALIPFTYWMLHSRRGYQVGRTVSILVMLGALLFAIHPQPTITKAEYDELETMKQELPEGEVLVVARHGLEWWVVWVWETKYANSQYTAKRIWNDYDAVLQIEDKQQRGAPPGLPPIHHRPGEPPVLSNSFDPAMRRPPDGFQPPHGSPPHDAGPFFDNKNQPQSEDMPEGNIDGIQSTLIYEGTYFKLLCLSCE